MHHPPIKKSGLLTTDSHSYKHIDSDKVEIPLYPHPGAFGVERRNHIHEGIDLYAPEGTPVYTMYDGIVHAIVDFTGPSAGSPWWMPTKAVIIKSNNAYWLYGEIEIANTIKLGDRLDSGTCIGTIKRVLVNDKGRPTSMLHLEKRSSSYIGVENWNLRTPQPDYLSDPTDHLIQIYDLTSAMDCSLDNTFEPEMFNL